MSIRLLILGLFSICLNSCSPNQVDVSNNVVMISQHVRIDDSAISSRDPFKVIEPVWWSVSIYDSKEKYENDLSQFSSHQRAVFAIMWYITEVNNGGHSQFYSNSTGIVWEDAMKGFNLIGLPEGGKIVEESAVRMGKRPSFDRDERIEVLESNDIDFEDLDNRLYSLDSALDLTKKIADHIEKHKSAFYFDGDVYKPKN